MMRGWYVTIPGKTKHPVKISIVRCPLSWLQLTLNWYRLKWRTRSGRIAIIRSGSDSVTVARRDGRNVGIVIDTQAAHRGDSDIKGCDECHST